MSEKQLGDHIDIVKQKRWMHMIQLTLMLIIVVAVLARYWQNSSTAAVVTSRSIAISSSAAGTIASHTYTYTLAGGSSVASIKFEYCSNSPFLGQPCTVPVGMNADGAVLLNQNGETGFTVESIGTIANTIIITRASASVTTPGQSSYTFTNIMNPTTANQSYYVRISAHNSIDASGVPTDQGSVVFVITDGDITIGAYVPPYIVFCVGQTLGANCTSASGFDLDMGTLSESVTATQTTQIAGSTNVSNGYTVYVLGYTLTAGTNVIPAMSSAGASTIGNSQFGLNARANSTPSIGQEPAGSGSLAPTGAYALPNSFKYVNGDAIATSPTSTDFNTLTISYVANTSQSQPAGVYTTTLTYVATSTF